MSEGRVSTFTEVRLKDADGKLSIPDGVIVAERGKTSWRCLVEVKTSNAPLKTKQVNRYLDMARLNGFDAVLTISNQITSSTEECPVDFDKRIGQDRRPAPPAGMTFFGKRAALTIPLTMNLRGRRSVTNGQAVRGAFIHPGSKLLRHIEELTSAGFGMAAAVAVLLQRGRPGP